MSSGIFIIALKSESKFIIEIKDYYFLSQILAEETARKLQLNHIGRHSYFEVIELKLYGVE